MEISDVCERPFWREVKCACRTHSANIKSDSALSNCDHKIHRPSRLTENPSIRQLRRAKFPDFRIDPKKTRSWNHQVNI
jgi:hypothetical protein